MNLEVSGKDIKKYYILERKSVRMVKDILLYYKCERCGKCCDREEVGLGIEEYTKFVKKYKELEGNILDKGLMKFIKHPCPFYTDKMCSIHEGKPFVCQMFPFSYAYGFFIGIALCDYGIKIYKDIKEFAALNNVAIYDGDSGDDTVKVVDAVNKLHSDINHDSYLSSLPMMTVPYGFLFKFHAYMRNKRRHERI